MFQLILSKVIKGQDTLSVVCCRYKYLRQLIRMEMKEQDLEAEVHCLKSQRDRLSKINVLNTAFHIWKQGSFGTINGFRLGQLPHSQVEWSEINAAWGQVALLINVSLDY